MIDPLKNLLKSQQKEDVKKEVRELIRFREDELQGYPFIKLNFLVYPSSFGIKNISDKEIKIQKKIELHSSLEKLNSLFSQLGDIEKSSEIEKYRRISYQSGLLLSYRKKGMDEGFISSMKDSMPIEYEIEISCLSSRLVACRSFRIYTDNIDFATDLSNQFDLFRESSLNMIINRKLSALESKQKI